VKLLFDANLSPALVVRLHSEYPDSTHVRAVGLRTGSDAQVWDYAKAKGFTIVSKDTDFRERSFVEGSRRKSCGWMPATQARPEIAALLHRERSRVEGFGGSTDASLLILSLGASAV